MQKDLLYDQLEKQVLVKGVPLGDEYAIKKTKTLFTRLREGKKVQESSVDFMIFLVHDFLDYAQIKVNKFRKNCKPFNIVDTVKRVMSIQQKKADDQGLEFFATFENIGEGSYSPIIIQDEQRIMQVLLNLQSNALKFTKQGKVEIKVRITQDNHLQISVTDTGIGINREDQ